MLSEPELRRRHRPRHLDFVSRPLAMTAPDALSLASRVEGGNNCVYGRGEYHFNVSEKGRPLARTN